MDELTRGTLLEDSVALLLRLGAAEKRIAALEAEVEGANTREGLWQGRSNVMREEMEKAQAESKRLGEVLNGLDTYLDLRDEWDEWQLDYDSHAAGGWWKALREAKNMLEDMEARAALGKAT